MKLSKEDKAKVAELYASGMRSADIAKLFNISQTRVGWAARTSGCTMGPTGRTKGIRWSNERKCKNCLARYPGILEHMRSADTLQETASLYNLTRERVRQFRAMFGLEPRLSIRKTNAAIRKILHKADIINRKCKRHEGWIEWFTTIKTMIEAGRSKQEIMDFMGVARGCHFSQWCMRGRDRYGVDIPKFAFYGDKQRFLPR